MIISLPKISQILSLFSLSIASILVGFISPLSNIVSIISHCSPPLCSHIWFYISDWSYLLYLHLVVNTIYLWSCVQLLVRAFFSCERESCKHVQIECLLYQQHIMWYASSAGIPDNLHDYHLLYGWIPPDFCYICHDAIGCILDNTRRPGLRLLLLFCHGS